jgi:transcriptional regulator with XRE-family HTH domain
MSKQAQKPKNDFLQSVGKRVQQFRHIKGNMTQEALADVINSTITYISNIETGSAKGITILMLKKIADALGVTVADLVEVNSDNLQQKADPNITSKKVGLLIQSIHKNDRKLAVKILKSLAQVLENSKSK